MMIPFPFSAFNCCSYEKKRFQLHKNVSLWAQHPAYGGVLFSEVISYNTKKRIHHYAILA